MPPASAAISMPCCRSTALKMFKPRPEVYALVTDHFKCKPARRDFRVVQPLGRDGGRLGRLPRRCWVNRGKMPDEYLDFPPRQELVDLNELMALA